jgi:hypothetical protein
MKRFAYPKNIAIISAVALQLSACPAFMDDFFEGEIRIFNADAVATITSISITEDCNKGWDAPIAVTLGPGAEATYKYDASEYDIRACYDTGTCYITADTKVEPDETTSVIAQDLGHQQDWCF